MLHWQVTLILLDPNVARRFFWTLFNNSQNPAWLYVWNCKGFRLKYWIILEEVASHWKKRNYLNGVRFPSWSRSSEVIPISIGQCQPWRKPGCICHTYAFTKGIPNHFFLTFKLNSWKKSRLPNFVGLKMEKKISFKSSMKFSLLLMVNN